MIRGDGKTPKAADRIRIKASGAALVQRLRAKGRKKSYVETAEKPACRVRSGSGGWCKDPMDPAYRARCADL
jgi:hypothetical protein